MSLDDLMEFDPMAIALTLFFYAIYIFFVWFVQGDGLPMFIKVASSILVLPAIYICTCWQMD